MSMGRKTTHKSKSHKRGPVRSKKVVHDGITFASGLEKYMYMALKKAKIKCEYEFETFVLQEGFMCNTQCYERQGNGKGDMVVVLTNLAELGGVSIEHCIDEAYSVISKRTGKMHNGTFVKDTL